MKTAKDIPVRTKEDVASSIPGKSTTTSRDSSFPVELQLDPALFLSTPAFAAYAHELLKHAQTEALVQDSGEKLEDMTLSDARSTFSKAFETVTSQSPLPPNRMYTENAAIGFISTNNALLDLFTELEKTVSGERLADLLPPAWSADPLTTLRIIWHARSIHLGKGEHACFYRCLAWLYKHHPQTLLVNLPELTRRVIAKRKTEDEGDEMVIVESDEEGSTLPELRYGVSHGYWKDLLNILVLAVEGGLGVLMDPKDVLNKVNPQRRSRKEGKLKHKRVMHLVRSVNESIREDGEGEPGKLVQPVDKHAEEQKHHVAIQYRYNDAKYRALHLTVARLFAAQLKKDKELLGSNDKKVRSNISLAAKWAPSLEKFHDRHTCIASTIAECLFPEEDSRGDPIIAREGETHRTAYLRTVREKYRAEILTPLRKFLEIVEIPISADAVHTIDYNTVPSLAMQNYKDLFARKDFSRFAEHVQAATLGNGKARMSGAVLQPATLVVEARQCSFADSSWDDDVGHNLKTKKDARRAIKAKQDELWRSTLNAQWQTLVKRIKESGTLNSTIAVADVSGSMFGPNFSDGTAPIDTAIGMALLIAEVAPPPFGGAFITFSENPAVVRVGGPDDNRSFAEKVRAIEKSNWNMNTDFGAVFMRLLLPMALLHKVPPEDMVKTIVVLSDMQFDQAQASKTPKFTPPRSHDFSMLLRPHRDSSSLTALEMMSDPKRKAEMNKKTEAFCHQRYATVHEHIRKAWALHGYELPTIVYWNLRANAGAKPVTGETENTLLVSGYSQGLLRGFMERGGFEEEIVEDEEEEDAVDIAKDDDGKVSDEQPKKKRKIDPMAGLKRAVEHPAYTGLRVVD